MISPPPPPATMSPHSRFLTLTLLLAVTACTGEGGPGAPMAGAPGATQPPASTEDSERIWAGLLPCRDCKGIDTRLVLRTERGRRDYVLTETYLGGSGRTSFNRAGSWTEVHYQRGDEAQVTYVLDPDQATQRFALQPDGALELLDPEGKAPQDALAYRLQRL